MNFDSVNLLQLLLPFGVFRKPIFHIYKRVFAGALRRWYNPQWFSEQIPSTPYDPIILRKAFEKVCSELALLLGAMFYCYSYLVNGSWFTSIIYIRNCVFAK